MVWIRIVISALAAVVAIGIAYLVFLFNGYEEDAGTGEINTLPFVIPWSLATIVLTGLVCGAIVSRSRRDLWAWWAFLLAAAMAIVVVVLFAIG